MTEITNVAEVEAALLTLNDFQKQIVAAETKRDKSIEFYRSLIENAREVCRKEVERIQFESVDVRHALKKFYDANPPKKGKTHKFAGGSFGYRHQDTCYSIGDNVADADNPALLEFVKNGHEDFLRVKESVNWAKLKTALTFVGDDVYLKSTGEVVPGMKAYPQPDKFDVKIGRVTADDLDDDWLKEDNS